MDKNKETKNNEINNDIEMKNTLAAQTEKPADAKAASGVYRRGSRVAAVIALFLLVYIPSTFNWFSGGAIATDILRDGAVYEALHTEAVVVRNEELIYAPADGFMLPAINDGERVAGHSLIATVYGSFSYEMMDEFEKVNQRLLREQYETLGQSAVFMQEVERIENDVTGAVRKMIPDINRNSLRDASERTKTVNGLLVKRAEAYGAIATDDPDINKLREEKLAIERVVAEGSSEVYSDAPGHLSFILDGLEREFAPQNLQEFDVGYYAGAMTAAAGESAVFPSNAYGVIEVKEGEPIAKIVKDNIFYLAIKAPADFLEAFSAGDLIRLRTENPYLDIMDAEVTAIIADRTRTGDKPGQAAEPAAGEDGDDADEDNLADTAPVEIMNPDDDEGVMIVRLTKYMYDFLNVRTVSVAVVEKYMEGLKVPLKSLRNVDAVNGEAEIVLVKGSHASVRRVRLLASNDVYAIIESYDASGPEGRVVRYDTYIRDAVNIEDGMPLSK